MIWIAIQFELLLLLLLYYDNRHYLLYNAESSVRDYSRIETKLRMIPIRAGNMVMITNRKQYF